MNFNFYEQTDLFVPKGQKVPFHRLVEQSAEAITLYSDRDEPFHLSCRGLSSMSSDRMISLVLVLPYLSIGRDYFKFERLEKEIFKVCSSYNFQGKWLEVAELLQVSFTLRNKCKNE